MQTRLATNRNPAAAAAADTAKLAKHQAGMERELSRQFCAYLTQRGVPHVVMRTDRKSTARAGWPDITALYANRACCVELKVLGGVVSREQAQCHAELHAAGVPLIVAYNLQQAIAFARENLNL